MCCKLVRESLTANKSKNGDLWSNSCLSQWKPMTPAEGVSRACLSEASAGLAGGHDKLSPRMMKLVSACFSHHTVQETDRVYHVATPLCKKPLEYVMLWCIPARVFHLQAARSPTCSFNVSLRTRSLRDRCKSPPRGWQLTLMSPSPARDLHLPPAVFLCCELALHRQLAAE